MTETFPSKAEIPPIPPVPFNFVRKDVKKHIVSGVAVMPSNQVPAYKESRQAKMSFAVFPTFDYDFSLFGR